MIRAMLRFYLALLYYGALFILVVLVFATVAGADPLRPWPAGLSCRCSPVVALLYGFCPSPPPGSPWPAGLEAVGAQRGRQRDGLAGAGLSGSGPLRVCSCTGPPLVRFCICSR